MREGMVWSQLSTDVLFLHLVDHLRDASFIDLAKGQGAHLDVGIHIRQEINVTPKYDV